MFFKEMRILPGYGFQSFMRAILACSFVSLLPDSLKIAASAAMSTGFVKTLNLLEEESLPIARIDCAEC